MGKGDIYHLAWFRASKGKTVTVSLRQIVDELEKMLKEQIPAAVAKDIQELIDEAKKLDMNQPATLTDLGVTVGNNCEWHWNQYVKSRP